MTSKVPPSASSSENVESSECARLALLAGVCAWMLAALRLGLALAHHEAGVDLALALGVVVGFPAVVLRSAVRTRRHEHLARGLNEGAVVIPFPVRRTSQGRRAS
ncbi:MAG TPA: hypothetical protein VF395_11800 [Polyangiaceae bacterium]